MFHWIDGEPVAKNPRAQYIKYENKWETLLDELKKQPGRWAILEAFPKGSQATYIAYWLKTQFVAELGFTFTSRRGVVYGKYEKIPSRHTPSNLGYL